MPHGNRPGDELGGRYTLVDLLSESRGGRFWRARDQVLARHVALHVISAEDERAPGLLEAARRSAAVQDRRMLRVLDADEREGLVYVVNEWGVGTSLDILLAEQPLTPRRAAWIVSEAADAIAAAHAVGVAHGHLVPENVLVDHVGSVRIIGLAVDAALRGVGPGRIEDDVVDLVGLLYSGLTGRWAGHAYSEVEPAPTEGDGLLRPRRVRAGIPRVLDQLCDEVLDAHHRGVLNGRRDAAPDDAAGMAALLQQFVGDPLEMAAAEAARGHGSPPSVDLTDPEPGSGPAWPGAGEDEPEGSDEPADDDGPTQRAAPAVAPPPDEPPGDATREVPVAADDREPTVTAPVPGDDREPTVTAPVPGDDREPTVTAPVPGDDREPTVTAPVPGEGDGDPDGEVQDDQDRPDQDRHDQDRDDQDRDDQAGAPTQAGVPIFRDDSEQVDWVSKQQQKPPPPPPLEDPPERPLFAPEPPDGQPQRRPRSGPPGRADDDSWPWGTGSGVRLPGNGAVFEEPADDEPGPVPGRRWFRLAVLLGVASLALLLVVFVADLLRGGQPLGMGPAPDDSPSASDDPAGAAPSPVTGLDVRSLDPQGDDEESDGDAPKVVDGDRATTWRTSTYFQQLGPQGLKTGVGLVVDLGEPTAVREVDLRLVGSPTTTQLYLTDEDPSDVDGLEPAGEIAADGRRGSAELSGEQSGRYLVLWLTSLPAVDGGFRGEIGEVVVRA